VTGSPACAVWLAAAKPRRLRELVAACKEARVEPLFCAPTAAATEVLRTEKYIQLDCAEYAHFR